jgi:F-type H+-transporting ATPase subunit alpha
MNWMRLPQPDNLNTEVTNPESPLSLRKAWLDEYQFSIRVSERGRVVSVGDGIVWIQGLPSAAIDEVLNVEDGSRAVVFHLTEDLVGAILLEQTERLAARSVVFRSGLRLNIPVGDALLGRVVDPLGRPLDGKKTPRCEDRRELDILSPPIIERDFVSRPLYTGNKIVDTLIPIGKGQRQLIIGDNGLGKSSLVVDIVINQKGKNVLCVYVLIGQKRSSVIKTIQTLNEAGALEYTALVVADASALPGLQYLAPFAGTATAEAWMRKGKDTLVVYDDLTAHADCYRELSLLLRRPPGREAYPADIFYLHSRLLERSTCLSAEMGGGSLTALPLVETKEGEIATYIPTNLISITDGQIYFAEHLFSSGFLPAIDITKSVSRIGGKAQRPEIGREAGRMKLDYLRFLDVEVFTRFGAKLEKSIERQIQRGSVLREILKQDQLSPLPIEFQMAWLVGFNDGIFDELKLERVPQCLERLARGVRTSDLTLSSPRNEWSDSVKKWLAEEGGDRSTMKKDDEQAV